MGRFSPQTPISCASRRRLARWLVGSPIREIERDLILETLLNTDGNRTASARLLGVSVRTLRNKIAEYTADGVDVPRHETDDQRWMRLNSGGHSGSPGAE
jgi:DNA-binding NtrC family response regulator